MTSSPPPNLSPEHARLWELAHKIQSGEWRAGSMHGDRKHVVFADGRAIAVCDPDYRRLPSDGEMAEQEATAAYIAAAHPTAITSFLTSHNTALVENEQLKAQVAVLVEQLRIAKAALMLAGKEFGEECSIIKHNDAISAAERIDRVMKRLTLPAAALAYMERMRKAEFDLAEANRLLTEEKDRASGQRQRAERASQNAGTWAAECGEQRKRAEQAESDLAAARLERRTPGTIEVCQRYVFHDCVNHRGHLHWKYGASKCTYGSCPRREIPAGGHPAQQGERLSDDVGNDQRPLPTNPHSKQDE